MSQYDQTSARALQTIKRKGGPVTFTGTSSTAPVYDPTTDTWSGGSAGGDVIGRAVQIKSNPDTLAALGLTVVQTVTLLVAASGLSVRPFPPMPFSWGGVAYVVVISDPLAPDGKAITYTIVGKV